MSLETPRTFTLIAPIQVGRDNETLDEITLCEPTAGDVEQLQKDQARDGAAGALIKLIARQAKLAPLEVRKIGARDFNTLQEYLMSFFPQPEERRSES